MSNYNDLNGKRTSSNEDIEKRRRARRASQARRARRNRIILVAFVLVILFVVGFVLGKLAKNNLGPRAEETTLTLKSDGSIRFEEVVELPSNYDTSGFKTFAKNQVKEYNAPEGEKVEFKAASVKEGVAYACIDYSSAKAYSDFTGYEAFFGTVKEANAAGYDVESNVSAKDGDLTGDEKVFILKEIVKVALPEDVLYTSENWVEQTEGGVNILPINNNYDAPPVAYIVLGEKAAPDEESSTESEGEK